MRTPLLTIVMLSAVVGAAQAQPAQVNVAQATPPVTVKEAVAQPGRGEQVPGGRRDAATGDPNRRILPR